MSDLQDLYQELIIDHTRRPRNKRPLENPDRRSEGFNPLCGDRITVYLKLKNDVVEDICFEGTGCAISTSSASLMTESLKGKTVAEAHALFERFHALLTGRREGTAGQGTLGKLEVFSGVSRFPARVKCATLAWHTLQAALAQRGEVVSTE